MTGTPKLILTGGTISMHTDPASGHRMPSGESLDALAQSIGFDVAVKPYTIDSIDFNIGEHYPKLFAAAKQALDEGKTPVICGGTDSLIWYSGLLTKDLMRHGYLQSGSKQKVLFLSSMKTLEDAPDLVRNILETGKTLAAKDWSGGFAISAEYAGSKQLVVHDVTNHFEKISSSLTNALRSHCAVGYVSNEQFTPYEAYTPQPATTTTERGYARIAPPLIKGHDSKAILAYMARIGEAQPPFDGIIIEAASFRKPLMHDHDNGNLVSMAEWLKKRGVRVVFCNPVHYNHATSYMEPAQHHPALGGTELALQKAGAEFITAMPKDLYIDMMLSTPRRKPIPLDDQEPAPYPVHKQKVLGIRYVPSAEIMNQAIDILAPQAKNLFFHTLPGDALSDAIAPAVKAHAAKTKLWKRFEYDGRQNTDSDHGDFIEGHEVNPYGAGKETEKHVAICPSAADPVRDIFIDQIGGVPAAKGSDRPSAGSSAHNR